MKGVKKTTTLHKICSRLRQHSKRSKPSEAGEKNTIKLRCGVISSRDQQYDTQSRRVAQVIQNGHKSKATLKQQKEQLIREVNKLAKLAGPLPSLKLGG